MAIRTPERQDIFDHKAPRLFRESDMITYQIKDYIKSVLQNPGFPLPDNAAEEFQKHFEKQLNSLREAYIRDVAEAKKTADEVLEALRNAPRV